MRSTGTGIGGKGAEWSFSEDGGPYELIDPKGFFPIEVGETKAINVVDSLANQVCLDGSGPELTKLRKCYEVYISYSWKDDEGEECGLVTNLYRVLDAHGYLVIRDKEGCGYRESLPEFMSKLGRSRCVVAIISDNYLRSTNCMHELTQIHRNQDFENRVFPVVLPGTKAFSPADRLEYVSHWRNAHEALCSQAGSSLSDIGTGGITSDLEKHHAIRNNVDEILGRLSSFNTTTYEQLSADEYALLRESIDKRLVDLSQSGGKLEATS